MQKKRLDELIIDHYTASSNSASLGRYKLKRDSKFRAILLKMGDVCNCGFS